MDHFTRAFVFPNVQYAMRCLEMGSDWWQYDAKTKLLKYAYVHAAFRETFDHDWTQTLSWKAHVKERRRYQSLAAWHSRSDKISRESTVRRRSKVSRSESGTEDRQREQLPERVVEPPVETTFEKLTKASNFNAARPCLMNCASSRRTLVHVLDHLEYELKFKDNFVSNPFQHTAAGYLPLLASLVIRLDSQHQFELCARC